MSRRTLLIVVFVSLALNLFLIGAVVGAGVMGLRMSPHRPEGRSGPGLMAATQALTSEQRAAWRAMLRDQAQVAGPDLRAARIARRDAWRRLAEEPLDTQAVLADLARSRALEQQARTAMERRMVAFAAGLPLADRARLGEAMSQMRPGPRMRGSGGGRPGRGPGDDHPGLPDR
jgi:uncharacterized membrane protein